ncbi:MAG: MBL fold metallo-hydrolase [Gammaproteobacteria bacterium]
MRFASLGSGSRGNATLVESGSTLVMVDCGFSCRETERRMARLGYTAAQLAAILVTHEHGDHIRGVCALARQYDVPVWLSAGTQLMLRNDAPPESHRFDGQSVICLGDLEIQPFTVPHDAREPCQFVFADGRHRFGLLTDAGTITAHIRASLNGCNALMIECNHDPEMLARGPYSASLKARVGGPLGHLSNAQAAGLLESIDCSRLQHVVAAHLSDKNNHPELARAALASSLGCAADWIGVAGQESGLAWRTLA